MSRSAQRPLRIRVGAGSVLAAAVVGWSAGAVLVAPAAAVGPGLHDEHEHDPMVRRTATPVEPDHSAGHAGGQDRHGHSQDEHAEVGGHAGGHGHDEHAGEEHPDSGDTVSGTTRTVVLGGFGAVNAVVLGTAFVMRQRRPCRPSQATAR